jgi:hypothetical protein
MVNVSPSGPRMSPLPFDSPISLQRIKRASSTRTSAPVHYNPAAPWHSCLAASTTTPFKFSVDGTVTPCSAICTSMPSPSCANSQWQCSTMALTHSSPLTLSPLATTNLASQLQKQLQQQPSTTHQQLSLTTLLPSAYASQPTILVVGLRQHVASGQHCNRTSVRAQRAQERRAAQGAGETALVKYRLPHLPYSPKSATGGRHSQNVSDKKGGRAATDDLC